MSSFFSLTGVASYLQSVPGIAQDCLRDLIGPRGRLPALKKVLGDEQQLQRLAPFLIERIVAGLSPDEGAYYLRQWQDPNAQWPSDAPSDVVAAALCATPDRPDRVRILANFEQRWRVAYRFGDALSLHQGAVAHTESWGDRSLLGLYRQAATRRTPRWAPVTLMALDTLDPVRALCDQPVGDLSGTLAAAGNGLYDGSYSYCFRLHFLSPPRERMDEMVLAGFCRKQLPSDAFWVYAPESLSPSGRTQQELMDGIHFPDHFLGDAAACVTGFKDPGEPRLKIGCSDWQRGRELASLLTGAVAQSDLLAGAAVETYHGDGLSIDLFTDPNLIRGYLLYEHYRALPELRFLLERLEGIPSGVVAGILEREHAHAPWQSRQLFDDGNQHVEALRRRIHDGRLEPIPHAERPSVLQSLGEPSSGTATAIGGRSTQQDSVLIQERGLPKGLRRVALVADGHGSKPYNIGARQSREAVRRFFDTLVAVVGGDSVDPRVVIDQAMRRMMEGAEAECPVGGSTFVGVVQFDDATYVVHIGDSRAYQLELGQGLRQVTTDHTWPPFSSDVDKAPSYRREIAMARFVGDRLIRKKMSEDDCERSYQYDLIPVPSSGTLILCTDGFTGMLKNDEWMEALLRSHPPQQAAQAIITAAQAANVHDNVLVAVVKLD